ncbi:putative aldouronate transport system permease protein [Paenibacillus taihuensis]|uniref:Putative aldouronate transport system permease protein n=1 Tax=Paenibacillus taihuensis TaxID=1156355 RepID=A0A3D9QTU6_9BACL|nr:ABC transporter permease subunit [Paenibacillus taihuensis]REE66656.1 putative aldouronate transport system permease protein [Paenibacillus taihuensis]
MEPIRAKWNWKTNWPLHFMLLPSVILLFIYSYIPMFGIIIAFENYKSYSGFVHSEWVGLDQFRLLFNDSRVTEIIGNTLFISLGKMVLGWIVPLAFALLLNEVRHMAIKRIIQSFVYLPYFISWVILGAILTDMLSPSGIINQGLKALHIAPVFFLGDNDWFRITLIGSDVWKEFGFGTIIYLAALAGVNPALYEAAEIDGASRWRQTWAVTVPSILPVSVIIATLSLGNILNGGFDQVYNLINPLVSAKGEIIDTYVFDMGLRQGAFSFSTAVGLFKSVVSVILITITYRMAAKFANYRIF